MSRRPDPGDYVTKIGYPEARKGPLQVLYRPMPAPEPVPDPEPEMEIEP